jgi:predicted NAD-dependent protein-ADP-ribosyltransferase YbiA (DUF1768 family)
VIEVIDSFSGKYECFSNFSDHPIPYLVLGDTILFKTSEHAFQGKRNGGKEIAIAIIGLAKLIVIIKCGPFLPRR